MFAISEIIKAAKEKGKPQGKVLQDFKIKGFGFSFAEFKSQIVNLFRSAAIGIGIGILPGIGGGTSNILAYTAAKNQSCLLYTSGFYTHLYLTRMLLRVLFQLFQVIVARIFPRYNNLARPRCV